MSNKTSKRKTLMCINCSTEMGDAQFYKSRNSAYDVNSYSLCKACVQRMTINDTPKFHNILRILDIPFLPEVWSEALTKPNPVGYYFVLVNNPRKRDVEGKLYKDMTYMDSPQINQINDANGFVVSDDEKLKKLSALFGENWSPTQLKEMDEELDEMVVQYGGSRDELPTLDLYSNLVLFRWLANKAYNEGDVKTGNDMTKMRDKSLKDNGLTMKDMRDRKNLDSFGMQIDMAEDRPLIPDKKYYDVNGIRFMFNKLVEHMERFAGGNKKSVDEDYEEMQEYMDNHEHYSEEME